MSEQLFPHPRRIVTGHDSSGNSIVVKDSEIECKPTPVKCNFAVLWETNTFPSNNNDDADPAEAKTESLVNDKGVILRVVDFPPKTETVSAISAPLVVRERGGRGGGGGEQKKIGGSDTSKKAVGMSLDVS